MQFNRELDQRDVGTEERETGHPEQQEDVPRAKFELVRASEPREERRGPGDGVGCRAEEVLGKEGIRGRQCEGKQHVVPDEVLGGADLPSKRWAVGIQSWNEEAAQR